MCRNPRRVGWDPLTRQEVKDLDFVEAEFDYFEELRDAA